MRHTRSARLRSRSDWSSTGVSDGALRTGSLRVTQRLRRPLRARGSPKLKLLCGQGRLRIIRRSTALLLATSRPATRTALPRLPTTAPLRVALTALPTARPTTPWRRSRRRALRTAPVGRHRAERGTRSMLRRVGRRGWRRGCRRSLSDEVRERARRRERWLR